MEMEWNAKWDWENLGVFGSKAIESPKNLQLADWTIVDDGDIHAGSFNLSSSAAPAAGGGGGGSSASSAKSSISASTDSIFKLSTSDGKKVEMSRIASPTGETSVGSAEALLGLKLGKRTYFENSGGGGGGGGAKSAAFPVVPTPSIMSTMKKTRSSGQNGPVCCLVEGCSVDLSLAKEYHRKHRVCDTHSKCPKVIVGGRERRFCQQCSRFHSLCEFDEKKRSCRRRLSDHNARRRKPQQETIQFNPSTPFYGGSQMNFMLNNSALRPPPANSWNNSSSRFTLTKGCWLKSDDNDEQLRINGFLASKNPVSKGSLMSSSSSLDAAAAAPEYRRALSLLSTNSWSSCVPESVQLQQQQQLHENGSSIIHHHHHPMVHGIPEGVPFPSSSASEFWPQHHLQSFKTPTHYDTSSADFYSNVLN